MRIRTGIVISFIFLFAKIVFGQTNSKQITHQQLIWYGYFNTIEFPNKLFLTTEIQERRFLNPGKQHQYLTRMHLHYKASNGWDAALGFTYFLQSPQDPYSTSHLTVPELRPHIEFNYKQSTGKITVSHRYKAEWRFFHNTSNGELTEGYWDYFRFRYRIGLDFTLLKKESRNQFLKLKINDEIHINAGSAIIKNVFDQNRVYIGLNYQLNKALSLELGYLNWFQQRTSGDQFYNRNIARITIFHKIILNKKSEKNGVSNK